MKDFVILTNPRKSTADMWLYVIRSIGIKRYDGGYCNPLGISVSHSNFITLKVKRIL